MFVVNILILNYFISTPIIIPRRIIMILFGLFEINTFVYIYLRKLGKNELSNHQLLYDWYITPHHR